MTTTQQYLDYSLLSFAAYGESLKEGSKNTNALVNAKFTQSQVDQFAADGWEVVDQSSDTIYGESSFSATLFHNTQTNEYVFANRGTSEPIGDILFADVLGIALSGTAGSQIIDMYRYYKQLITPANQAVQYSAQELEMLYKIGYNYAPLKYEGIAAVYLLTQNDTGLGKLDPTQVISTTGHSLGGHLSLWLDRMIASNISAIYTYNGAGNGNENGVNALPLFTTIYGSVTGTPYVYDNDPKVKNIYGYGGPAIIAGVGGAVGPNIPINIEYKDPLGSIFDGLYNHSIVQLTDAIAVVNLLNKLDANLTTSKFNEIFDKGSNKIGQSLEGVLDGVRNYFGMTNTTENDNRPQFYDHLYDLQNSATFQALIGKVALVAPPTSASEARDDFGAFLSLFYLTPFSLKASDNATDALLRAIHTALSDKWTDDNNLSDDDIAAGKLNFSDMYLNDRAAMLSWKNLINEKDFIDSGLGYLGVAGAATQHFEDKASGTIIDISKLGPNKRNFIFGASLGDNPDDTLTGGAYEDHLYGLGGNDQVNGGDGNDYIEGNAGQDTLHGGEGNDILIGGTEEDILDGGTGNDQLKGGAGADVYKLSGTYGTDIITDSDGVGIITVGEAGQAGTPLTGGTEVVNKIYRHETTQYNYTLLGSGADQTLVISKDDDKNRIIIRNWQTDKNLNITLQDQALEEKTINLLEGDFEKFNNPPEGDSDHRTTEFERVNGEFDQKDQTLGGNYKKFGALADTKDLLQGTSSSNSIYGYGNDDALSGQGGDDYLNGGEGNDLIFGGAGKDTLVGGAGNDVLIARYNATFNDLNVWQSELGVSKAREEAFYSLVSLSSNHDEIGRGWGWATSSESPTSVSDKRNVLNINSSHYMDFAQANSLDKWYSNPSQHYYGYVDRQKIIADNALDHFTGLVHIDPLSVAGSPNIISGGTGNDYIIGGDAADIIDGGDDDDQIYGKEGDDIIKGGAGKDVISGDGFMTNINGDTNFFWNVSGFDKHGNDIIDGGTGEDWIYGQGGNDVINGGDDNDNLWGDDGAATTLPFANHGDDYLDGGAGDDQLIGGGGNDILYGGIGNDILFGDGTDTQLIPENRQGKDYIEGGAGEDTIFGGAKEDTLLGGLGNDQLVGGNDSDYLDGGEGNDKLWGGNGNDEILGGKGDDFLNGEDGNDTLIGGAGKDRLYGGSENDVLIGSGDGDWLDGEAGADTIYVGKDDNFKVDAADTVIYLDKQSDPNQPTKASSATVSLNATLGSAGITINLANNITIDIENGLVANENVTYGFGDGSAILHSDLMGATLNSVVNLSSGAAALFGGALADNISAIGTTASSIYGGLGNDTLAGNSANNVLEGGAGTDTMAGGAGDDIYIVDSSTDIIIESEDAGIDTVNSSLTYTLNAHVENLILTGTANINGSGNELDNVITGNNADNTLNGGIGGDTLNGNAGNDILNGGADSDNILGDEGNDQLNGGAGDDIMAGGTGNDNYILSAGDGFDSIEDTQGLNQIIFGTGITRESVHASQYQGDDGNFYLLVEYGASADKVAIKDGLAGGIQSYHFVDGSVLTHADLIGSEGVPFHVYGTVNNDTLMGTSSGDILEGGAGDDELLGLEGSDELLGGVGADTLVGNAGDDLLDGGLGNDLLDGGSGQDSYVMRWGMGRDTVIDNSDVELNTIKLDAGINFSDLDILSNGDDLFIYFKGVDEGLIIQNYYASELPQWGIVNDTGDMVTMSDFIDNSGDNNQTLIEQEMANYEARVKSLYITTLSAHGYRLGADGLLRYTHNEISEYNATTRNYVSEYAVVTQTSDEDIIFRSTTATYENAYLVSSSTETFRKLISSGFGSTTGSSGNATFHSFGNSQNGFSGGGFQIPQGASYSLTPNGIWIYPNGYGSSTGSSSYSSTYSFNTATVRHDQKVTLEKFIAGASNNLIDSVGYAVVDGGSGDDVIYGNSSGAGWEQLLGEDFPNSNLYNYWEGYGGYDARNFGALLYGNDGNDSIVGSYGNDVLIGGEGGDYIDGNAGADRYLVYAGESGIDIIIDSDYLEENEFTESGARSTPYQNWYYRSLGITNWENIYAGWDEGELPPLPVISPTDYLALAPLYAAGVIAKDTVEFGTGIALADMSFSWGQATAPEITGQWANQFFVATLDISWGVDQGVRVAIPLVDVAHMDNTNSNGAAWFLGAGIEQFKFADGTLFSMGQILSLAPPMPSFTPILFNLNSGQQSVSYLWKTEIAFGEDIDQSDIVVIRDGVDVLFSHVNGVDQLRIQNWFANPNSPSLIHARFSDDDFWDNEYITDQALGSIVGTAGDDVLVGVQGYQNTIHGLAGNDQITGHILDDDLFGDDGNDILSGNEGNDNLTGGTGNDTLSGGGGSDAYYISSGDGEDTIIETSQFGEETDRVYLDLDPYSYVIQRSQNDLIFSLSADKITFANWFAENGKTIEEIVFGDGTVWDSDVLNALNLNLTLMGTSGDDFLIGGSGDDTIIGDSGDDSITGGLGDDYLSGDEGQDTYYFNLGDGADNIYDSSAIGETTRIVFGVGVAPAMIIHEYSDGDFIMTIGQSGDQIRFYGPSLYDLAENLAQVELVFADTNTTVNYLDVLVQNQIIQLGTQNADTMIATTSTIFISAGHGGDTITGGINTEEIVAGQGDDVIITNSQLDYSYVSGEDGDDIITANTSNYTYLYGGQGNDIINGGVGLDFIDGETGDDILMGSAGDDTYYFNLGDGHDLINNTATDNDTATDTIFFDSILPESVILTQVSNDLVITISVTDSVTIKDYYAATDNKIDQIRFYFYDLANDTYSEVTWDNATFEAMVLPSNHAPEVAGSISLLTATDGSALNYVLPVATLFTDADQGDALTYTVTLEDGNPLPSWLNYNAATFTLSGTPDPTHIGNLSLRVVATDLAGAAAGIDFDLTVAAMPDQTLIGTTANNNLVGGSGNDTLDGLAGTDTMTGGYGNDTYFVERAADQVIEQANQGTDTINTTVTYTTSANVENLTLLGTAAISANGNELDNILVGNVGNNTLDGKAGADSMIGGLGNDVYVVDSTGDTITEFENEGIDTVKSGIDYVLGEHLERLTLTGDVALNATGNELDNIITGNVAGNHLNGGLGNDNLNGGLGADTLIGGQGNDIYVVENELDTVIEQVGEGTDLVQSSVTYTLASEVENLTLTGSASINGTGNELNNTIIGNSSNNQLSGGAGNDNLNGGLGADTLVGGLGNDIYTVDNANDVVTELAGEGTDRVNSSIDYTLGAEIENLTLTGTIAISGTGNELNNTITGNTAENVLIGNAGNDILNGGVGADIMLGGLDNDTYTVDNINDVVTELIGEGVDRVNSSISYTLGDHLENLTLTGTTDIMGFGNSLANVLAGNTGNNYLYGLAANDTITGNNGYDILQGGDDNDTISGNAGNSLLDGGSGNDRLTGGTENDLIMGGTGNDTITTGAGYDVISFNKGDGADTIAASTGADNTLSLGGNFAYSDLSLTKTGNNLILKMGATDQITLTNWYASSPTNKSVVNLQVIAEAIQGFSLGGADALRDNKIENFNFTNLVAAFDAAGATANWQLTDARLTSHLQAGSDSAAIGGDLAYQYGKNSNLTGMGLLNAQSVIADVSFGQLAQTLNNPSTWQAEGVKLG